MAPTLAIFLGAFASFSGFLFGYDTGYISGCKEMVPFQQAFGTLGPDGTYALSTGTQSLLTSILSIGTCVGALFAGMLGDKVGRRYAIIIYIGLFCIGVALQTAVKNVAGFSVGRVFAGLGVGGTSCLVPLYQAESAPKHMRGAIVAAYQFFITVGLLVAAVVVNATKDFKGNKSFELPIGLQFIWAAIIVGGLMVLPESPRYTMMKGDEKKTRDILARLNGYSVDSIEVEEQVNEIKANLERERETGSGSWAECFRGGSAKTRTRILTGCTLQALQQLTGINFIFYYGTTFFKNSGISDPFLITIATSVVNVGMTIPGMIAVDRLGRRRLMIYGSIAMAICQLLVAVIGVAVKVDNSAGQKALVALVCIYIGHFAAIWGPFAWVITSEIYPLGVRAKGMSLSTASNWLWNFGIGYATPYMVDVGPGKAGLKTNVFWIWGGFCVLCVVFSYFMIPETKGLSLEQVDLLYRNSSPRQSTAFRNKMVQENMHDEITADGRLQVHLDHAEIDRKYHEAGHEEKVSE